MSEMLKQPQYVIEGIILRRLHEKRIEGYTIETAKEIVEAVAALQSSADSAQPKGWKLVPIKPDKGQIVAGCENNPTQWTDETPDTFSADVANDVYVSMVAAAPTCTEPQSAPSDDLEYLVARFSKALLAKLKLARANGRSGWELDDWEEHCQAGLLRHLAKGDPRDVAAYCAFMWHHGWATKAADQQSQAESDGEYVKLANESLARCMDENQTLLARIKELTCPQFQADSSPQTAPLRGPDCACCEHRPRKDCTVHGCTMKDADWALPEKR
jgi:hypothetical protein